MGLKHIEVSALKYLTHLHHKTGQLDLLVVPYRCLTCHQEAHSFLLLNKPYNALNYQNADFIAVTVQRSSLKH